MKPHFAQKRFVPGSSRGRPDLDSLLAQMAEALADTDTPAGRLRELRGGRTQPEIAAMVPVSLRGYQEWEAGGGISSGNLERLAEIHGVSEEYILYGPDTSRAPSTRVERIEAKIDLILEHLGIDPDGAKDQFEQELEDAAHQHGEQAAGTAPAAHAQTETS